MLYAHFTNNAPGFSLPDLKRGYAKLQKILLEEELVGEYLTYKYIVDISKKVYTSYKEAPSYSDIKDSLYSIFIGYRGLKISSDILYVLIQRFCSWEPYIKKNVAFIPWDPSVEPAWGLLFVKDMYYYKGYKDKVAYDVRFNCFAGTPVGMSFTKSITGKMCTYILKTTLDVQYKRCYPIHLENVFIPCKISINNKGIQLSDFYTTSSIKKYNSDLVNIKLKTSKDKYA